MATKTRRLADLLANIDDSSNITSSGIAADTLIAGDIAPNAITASELANDAVDTAAILNDAVDADKLASNAVVTASIVDANITTAKIGTGAVTATKLDDVIGVKPHIIPDKLYPAYEGFLTNNSQNTFTDTSTNAGVVTSYGHGVRHTGAEKKFGSTSIKFNGVNDYLTVADDADFDWGTGDFTVELWFMPYGAVGSAEVLLASNNSGTTDSEFYLRSENGRLNWARGSDNLSGGTSDFNTLNTWYHVAFVNASGTITCYKNGTALYNFSAGSHDYNPTDGFSIGARKTSGAYAQWGQYYIDDVRVVKGLAVYTGNFTAPTGALTTTWAANPFGGSNTAANADASKVGLLLRSAPTGVHSGAYGTAQADGKSYFYTDVPNRKPIADPRIGAHFGSQRHMTTSAQVLPGTNIGGRTIYSFDGRENIIGCVSTDAPTQNVNEGVRIVMNDSEHFMEVTGYFNAVNVELLQQTSTRTAEIRVDGVRAHDAFSTNISTVISSYGARFVNSGAWYNIDITSASSLSSNTQLGIHTLKYKLASSNTQYVYGWEMVAHGEFVDATCDTNHTIGLGSPASTSKITMNSTAQVVAGMSVAGTGITAGTTVLSVDSATVLTLSAATTATNANQTFTFGTTEISIPAQKVVSYGKKFALTAAAKHYNPFARSQTGAAVVINSSTTNTAKLTGGWAGTGATYYSSELDTATSLGLDVWVSGGEYFRPVNGGRVVWWVNSSGALKCSVNMMPPAGTAAAGGSLSMHTGGLTPPGVVATHNTPTGVHNWATRWQPAFHSTTVDNSLAEEAKTFYYAEFGNGAANGGTASSGWPDASMLNSSDDIAFVLDDGLTGMAGNDVQVDGNALRNVASDDTIHLHFIGTGLSILRKDNGTGTDQQDEFIDEIQVSDGDQTGSTTLRSDVIAQNMPYGTHYYRLKCENQNAYARLNREFTIHQPKRPPIPEDAVILADYMLMAEFVPHAVVGGQAQVSKGCRGLSVSRDQFYDTNVASTIYHWHSDVNGMHAQVNCNNTLSSGQWFRNKIPFFGTDITWHHYANRRGGVVTTGRGGSYANISAGGYGGSSKHTGNNVGLCLFNSYKIHGDGTEENMWMSGEHSIACQTHTSSHYQEFETPYLKQLVGGDRNMEQTNLVVTADGKTWDEVTRDTSYISPNICVAGITRDAGSVSGSTIVIFDEHRGFRPSERRIDMCFKDFAYSYDKFICLVDGQYEMFFHTYTGSNTHDHYIVINGDNVARAYSAVNNINTSCRVMQTLKRFDIVQIRGGWWGNNDDMHTGFFIHRLGEK